MSTVLNYVAKKERFMLPSSANNAILETSQGNLRKALLVFEAMRMQHPDLSGDVEVAKPDWETYCGKVADAILQEQTAQKLLDIRAKIYELLSHCIPPTVVMKVCELLRGQETSWHSGLDHLREASWEGGWHIKTANCALDRLLRESIQLFLLK